MPILSSAGRRLSVAATGVIAVGMTLVVTPGAHADPGPSCVVRDSAGVPVIASQSGAFQQRALAKLATLNPDPDHPVAQVVMCSDGVHLKITSPTVTDGVDADGDYTQHSPIGITEAGEEAARLVKETGATGAS